MCNKKKAYHIFRNNDAVYADACTLMNVDRLELFFGRYGDLMKKTGTKIIIPASVRKELVRLAGSKEPEKKSKANSCINALFKFTELIDLEGGALSSEGIDRIHADPEIIAMLTLRRRDDRQLMLTNDGDLASDVFRLNDLRSCHGKPITVCYIDRDGYLKLSDCMTEAMENAVHSTVETEKTEPTVKKRIELEENQASIVNDIVPPEAAVINNLKASGTPVGDSTEVNDSGDGVKTLALIIGVLTAGIASGGLHRHRREIKAFAKWIARRAA